MFRKAHTHKHTHRLFQLWCEQIRNQISAAQQCLTRKTTTATGVEKRRAVAAAAVAAKAPVPALATATAVAATSEPPTPARRSSRRVSTRLCTPTARASYANTSTRCANRCRFRVAACSHLEIRPSKRTAALALNRPQPQTFIHKTLPVVEIIGVFPQSALVLPNGWRQVWAATAMATRCRHIASRISWSRRAPTTGRPTSCGRSTTNESTQRCTSHVRPEISMCSSSAPAQSVFD